MNKAADFITKVFDRFLLLDLLSYVCPGLIIILSFIFGSKLYSLNGLLHLEIGFWQGLVIFLFAYIIGLGINVIGQLIASDFYCKDIELFYSRMAEFLKCDNKDFLSKRERYVILKQMARNNWASIILGIGIFFLCKLNANIALIVGLVILVVLLFCSARKTLRNHKNFEDVVTDKLLKDNK